MSNWSKLVGRRLLVRRIQGSVAESVPPSEVVLKEIAPSGSYLLFHWPIADNTGWVNGVDHEVVEELPSEVPPDAKTLRAGAELAAREIWWREIGGRMSQILATSIEEAARLIMLQWGDSPRGTLLGHDANGKPFSDVVNGSGMHHRAEFEQAVRAWLVIHF